MMKSRPDKQPRVEALGEYVKRILEEKQLTMYDVEVRSERRIADAYVANVLNGVAKNLTVEKLKALAVGLGEPEDDVFKVARGLPLEGAEEQSGEPWSAGGVIKALEKVMASPEMTKILRALMGMSLREVRAVLKYAESGKRSKGEKKRGCNLPRG
jgi:transcriptional regulator with XRE-family HTH domain